MESGLGGRGESKMRSVEMWTYKFLPPHTTNNKRTIEMNISIHESS